MERNAFGRHAGESLLILLLVFLPWLEGGATPFALFVSHTGVLLLFGMTICGRARSGPLVLPVGWESVAALALIGVSVVSFLGVDYLFGPFLTLWNLIVGALLALTLVLMGPDGWRRRAIVIAAAAGAQAMAALLMPVPQNLTTMGTFANANQLAAYLGVGALVTAGLTVDAWRRQQRSMSLIFLLAVLLDLSVIVRAGARGALISVLLSGSVWIAVSARHAGRRVRLVLWSALLVLAVLGAAGVAARFERVSDPYRFDRMGIWGAALKAGIDHPVVGMGPGLFESRGYLYNFPLDREMFRYSKRINSAHSTYLEVFAATGFAGLTALLIFLFLLKRRLLKLTLHEAPHDGVVAGVVFATMACLIHGLVETPFDTPAVTWSLLAVLVPMTFISRPIDAAIGQTLPRASWVVAGLIASIWAGAVVLPYAAHFRFDSGVRASVPGAPAAEFNDAIVLNPYNPLYWKTRAQLRWRRDLPLTPAVVAAVDLDLRQASRLDSGNPETWFMRAQLHARSCFEIVADPASVGRAEEYFREVISLGSHDPRPHVSLAMFLLAQGRSTEAMQLLREALTQEPRYVAARVALTRVLLDAGDRAGAEAEFETLKGVLGDLKGYFPKNGYEEDLMKSESGSITELERRLQ